MAESKHYWIPVYLCKRCGQQVQEGHHYNDGGAKCFPQIDTPFSIGHRCTPGNIGLAELVGLKRVKKGE